MKLRQENNDPLLFLVGAIAVLALLLILAASAAHAQTLDTPPPAVEVTQPAPAPTVEPPPSPLTQTLAQTPDDPATYGVIWWASVGSNGLATYLKWSSSWKQPTLDLVHAEPSGPYQGRYYVRGTVYDWGLFSLTSIVQYCLARKFPALRKTFSYVNFGNTAVGLAQYGFNATNH